MSFDAKAVEVDNKVIALRHPKKETAIQFQNRAHYLYAYLHGDHQQSAHASAMLHARSAPLTEPQEDQPA